MKNDKLYQVSDPKKKTVYDYAIEYLFEKYDILYNEISHDFQISLKKKKQWSYLNLNSLIIELTKAGIDISTSKLEILIKSELIDKYNPRQFEIIGLGISNSGKEIGVKPYKPKHKKYRKEIQKRGAVDGDLYIMKNGEVTVPYARIIIKNRKL